MCLMGERDRWKIWPNLWEFEPVGNKKKKEWKSLKG
jgi:hypothetical protein